MRVTRLIYTVIITSVLIACEVEVSKPTEAEVECSYEQTSLENIEIQPKIETQYINLSVPNVNSYFKAYMDYRAVTNKRSPQYKLISQWSWADSEGFMRASGEKDLGIDDYYLIALGSYYGTTIGTKYRITLNTGNIFYGILGDCKADKHTNSTNQYNTWNNNVVEFIVDSKKLNKDVKRQGSANVYMPLNGSIAKIERIDFKSR